MKNVLSPPSRLTSSSARVLYIEREKSSDLKTGVGKWETMVVKWEFLVVKWEKMGVDWEKMGDPGPLCMRKWSH